MSHIAGTSAKRVREEDGREEVAAKRRCAPDNTAAKRGYREDTPIPFKGMLYRRKSHPKDRNKSLVPRNAGGEMCEVKDVMRDILSMKTGVDLPGMTAEYLMTHQALRDLVERMVKNFKRVNLKGVEERVVEKCKGERKHPERYTLARDNVFLLLRCSPAQTPSTLLLQELPRGGRRQPEHQPLTYYQVWTAVLAVALRVLPKEAWGSQHNLARLKDMVRRITLLGRHDALFLGHFIHRWKVTDCGWTASFSTFQEKTFIVAKFFRWVVERILMHTIGTMFYVTEMSGGNYQLYYYLKRKWNSIHDKALNALMRRDVVRLVSHGEGKQAGDSTAKMSPQEIRFLPKLKGVRPIMPIVKVVKSFDMLKARLLIIELCKTTGSISAKTTANFCGMWQKFNENLCAAGEAGPLYFVRADVRDAYGSVLHSKLFELLEKSASKFDTTIRFGQYGSLYKAMKHKRQRTIYILLDTTGQPVRSPVCQGEQLSQMWDHLVIHVGKTLALVRQSVTPVFCGSTKSWFKMVEGLPQGASLSPSLCEFYYSAMTTTYLEQFVTGHSILLRTVDDFLYVSTSRVLAESILSKLKCGIPDFNCYINESKTVTNINDMSLHRVYFNGVTVCLQSRQLLVDASGLVDIIPRYSLRLNGYKAPGKFVADRVQRIINARLSSSMLCPIYTSTTGLLDNVWRVGFLTGARLVAMLHTVLAPRGPINARYVASVVIKGGRRVWRIATSVWRRAKKTLSISKDVVMIAFVGGVSVMLSLPGLPKWPAVYRRLWNFLKVLIRGVEGDAQALLPRLPRVCLDT